MTQQLTAGARFRKALAEEKPLQVMGTVNAYAAMMATQVGYRAIYLSGAGVANYSYGLPDLGITSLDDVLTDVRRITAAVDTPLLVDIDTGWGTDTGGDTDTGTDDTDTGSGLTEGNICITTDGGSTTFCGLDCSHGEACPDGASCQDIGDGAGGVAARQCIMDYITDFGDDCTAADELICPPFCNDCETNDECADAAC